MSETNDGGPAFPCPNDAKADEMGVSPRDYFVAKALNGMAANPDYAEKTWEILAEQAYIAADAMLKARQQ